MISSDGQNKTRPAPPKTSGGFDMAYSMAPGPQQGNQQNLTLAPGSKPPSRPPGAPMAPPFSGAPAKPIQYSGQSTIKPPQYIDIEDTEASVNNTLARGQQAGDQRYQVKQMDRAGVSRGKGQQTAAQIQSAKEMASSANQAAETRAQDQMSNEKMRADYEKAREQEALAIAGAQFGMNFAGMQARLAQQRAAAELMFSMMR
jgi:hypothetical protein